MKAYPAICYSLYMTSDRYFPTKLLEKREDVYDLWAKSIITVVVTAAVAFFLPMKFERKESADAPALDIPANTVRRSGGYRQRS